MSLVCDPGPKAGPGLSSWGREGRGAGALAGLPLLQAAVPQPPGRILQVMVSFLPEMGSRAGVWGQQDPMVLGRVGDMLSACRETDEPLGGASTSSTSILGSFSGRRDLEKSARFGCSTQILGASLTLSFCCVFWVPAHPKPISRGVHGRSQKVPQLECLL